MMTGSTAAMPMHEDFDLMFIDMMIRTMSGDRHGAGGADTRRASGDRDLAQDIIAQPGNRNHADESLAGHVVSGRAVLPMDQMVASMTGMMGGVIGMGATMDPAGEAQALCLRRVRSTKRSCG